MLDQGFLQHESTVIETWQKIGRRPVSGRFIPSAELGTIAAAAVINEIIAVIAAKKGFELAGENE